MNQCPKINPSLTHTWKWKVKMKVAQSCPTLCDSMNCSPPGSSGHGISQAGILEWDAIPFSRGSSQPRDRTQVSLTVGKFFTSWATREAFTVCKLHFPTELPLIQWVIDSIGNDQASLRNIKHGNPAALIDQLLLSPNILADVCDMLAHQKERSL